MSPRKADISLFVNQHVQGLRRLVHFGDGDVEKDLRHLGDLVESFQSKREAIDRDPRLSDVGKRGERAVEARKVIEQIRKWSAEKIEGLTDHAGSLRMELLSAEPSEAPTDRQLDAMLARLSKLDSLEIQIAHGAASDREQIVIETVAREVGRLPAKTEDGGITWQHLVDPEAASERALARATVRSPEAAEKLREVLEIKGMVSTVAELAVDSIKESLPFDLQLEEPKIKIM